VWRLIYKLLNRWATSGVKKVAEVARERNDEKELSALIIRVGTP